MERLITNDMKKSVINISVVIIPIIVLTSCYYDNEEVLYGEEQCTTDSVTYLSTISPIISTNCLGCHYNGNTTGVTLETYAQVKTQADNGNLVGVVTHSPGYPAMPKNNPKLSKCDIDAITKWVESGSVNN
jgi:hypothetical protein